MKKSVKLAIAALVAGLAATVGIAGPADAKPPSSQRIVDCC